MSDWYEIYIGKEGINLIFSKRRKKAKLFLPKPVDDLGGSIRRFASKNRSGSRPVVFFIEEELLFFKKFSLPLQTVNVREAVRYQLSALTPFEEEALYDFTVYRGRKEQEITLYAVKSDEVIPYVRQAAKENFHIMGIFPASQRYVTGAGRNKDWALLTGGPHPKLISFKGVRLIDRSLWLHQPGSEDMMAADLPEVVYGTEDVNGGEDFRKAGHLLSDPPLLKNFNLLPSKYKRPDYLRYALIVAGVLNIAAILILGGVKEYKIREYLTSMQSAIEEVRPRAEQLQDLRAREKELGSAVEEIEKVKIEFDLIGFLERVTETLPRDSYLDRIRIEGLESKAVHLQGYTDDISRLTATLGDLGEVKLRSTRQRRNKIYFHVELNVI